MTITKENDQISKRKLINYIDEMLNIVRFSDSIETKRKILSQLKEEINSGNLNIEQQRDTNNV